ncbi:FecR family protein [Chitinophaga sancti]|uniref:FecR domain-containing protein n=1 Tax=Chitinophaga sancti TaxID=1004 RepID=A0A1K1QCI7_9BACT|nr:FecR domain-containing protein [Chitinophaga sancti]WQD61361.1 FecR domain-containing protein [Chitinophaga sancti]WQG93086.1 FecR domain-containing protein [Chitinophaga sancti]SFW57436.1 FecR family protein [Chitinophaga sancti]
MKIDNSLLEKYFKGNCTDEEVKAVEAYLDQPATPEADEWFAQQYEESAATPVVSMKRTSYHRWYGVAATVAVLISLGTWMWQWQQKSPERYLMAMKWDTLANAGNDIKLMTMADGSEVWLAPHSSLIYNQQYNDTSRELWLEGEGYFNVKHDPGRPFSVHTGQLKTTALGTAFNIATNNRADGTIAVSLLEGKVSVATSTFSCILHPGQMVTFNNDTAAFVPVAFNRQEVSDWRQGKMVFDQTPLEDAFARIQSRKGCKIIVDPAFKGKRKVSGTFPASTPVENILEAMQYVHGFRIEKRGINTYAIVTP